MLSVDTTAHQLLQVHAQYTKQPHTLEESCLLLAQELAHLPHIYIAHPSLARRWNLLLPVRCVLWQGRVVYQALHRRNSWRQLSSTRCAAPRWLTRGVGRSQAPRQEVQAFASRFGAVQGRARFGLN